MMEAERRERERDRIEGPSIYSLGDYCSNVTLNLQTFIMVKSTLCSVIAIDYQHRFTHLSIGLVNNND